VLGVTTGTCRCQIRLVRSTVYGDCAGCAWENWFSAPAGSTTSWCAAPPRWDDFGAVYHLVGLATAIDDRDTQTWPGLSGSSTGDVCDSGIRDRKVSNTARISAALAGIVLASGGSAAAHADTVTPLACSPDVSVSITSKSSNFIGASGTRFKDGPGGTISVSVTKDTTISATVSSSVEVDVSEIVASAKVSVSASVTGAIGISVGHSYSHDITKNKYGNLQYGTWGYKVNWEKTRTNGNCKGETVLASGTATLPTSSLGWKYWETSS
jgi:hypothetical protein